VPDVRQGKLEGGADDGPGLLGELEVGRVDRVDAADVVEVEAPEVDRGRRAAAPAEDGLDAVEQVVRELEVAVGDPLLGLSEARGRGCVSTKPL